jgi:predicted DNA-binding transcriptional regulator AlpA
MAKRFVRPKEAMDRLGCRRSKFYADYIGRGLLRPVRLGARSIGILESELDALIDELTAKRDVGRPRKRERPL